VEGTPIAKDTADLAEAVRAGYTFDGLALNLGARHRLDHGVASPSSSAKKAAKQTAPEPGMAERIRGSQPRSR
jgi:hypothetical protein